MRPTQPTNAIFPTIQSFYSIPIISLPPSHLSKVVISKGSELSFYCSMKSTEENTAGSSAADLCLRK